MLVAREFEQQISRLAREWKTAGLSNVYANVRMTVTREILRRRVDKSGRELERHRNQEIITLRNSARRESSNLEVLDERRVEQFRGELLLPDFQDPQDMARVRITRRGSDGAVRNVTLNQHEGRWLLQSHSNYPLNDAGVSRV